ncbi:hypothetical protein [Kitasatospora viridis]|uniref:Uncharacterized protein n=1 Tax=Kitasatospora viridis TaxID=281105 RepID=A0A561SDM0_9ACTN|nr:hypothetical protein [Kitasatospora viridis]TWF72973.1 hypothetical protein FHX73_16124 [Kitasatospora viridis]
MARKARRGGGPVLIGGCIVGALAVLLTVLFLADHDGSARGTGHDPGNIALPKTVEQQPRQGAPLVADTADQGMPRRAQGVVTTVVQGVYADAPAAPDRWVVTTARNTGGQLGPLLAGVDAPSKDVVVSRPALRIAGSTTCSQNRATGRTTCLWYDENLFLQIGGPAGPADVQQVLLRVYDGTER